MPRLKILLVDGDASVRIQVTQLLEAAGYAVDSMADGESALQWLDRHPVDLLLMEWLLPGISGLELTKNLKQTRHWLELPIILLSSRASEDDKVLALELGADDYVTKPFSSKELIARVKVALRRQYRGFADDILAIGDLQLNDSRRQLQIDKTCIDISPVEYRLMAFFMRHPDKVHRREDLLKAVWGDNLGVEARTVDVQVGRLRKLLGRYGRDKTIQTVRGFGYRFSVWGD